MVLLCFWVYNREMKQFITTRFKKFKKENVGAIPTLSKTIRGMNYSKSEINLAFKKFVPDNEYVKNKRDKILEWLYQQTK